MSKKQKQHQTIVPGNPLAVNVVGTQREDLGFALKVWKRKVKNSGILVLGCSFSSFLIP